MPRESSQSAPEAEGLTLDLESLARVLELSVTSNEKHSPSQLWLRRFRQGGWTRRLFGLMCEPSTATSGAERWIGSLVESPVSPTASPDSDEELPTTETCGRVPPESSENSDPASFSWRMLQASYGFTTKPSDATYKAWVTELGKDYSRRMKSERRIFANACSSWHTPAARMSASHGGTWNGRYYITTSGGKESSSLTHQTANWRSPRARDYHEEGKRGTYRVSLAKQVREHWRSPVASDAEGGVMEIRPGADAKLKLRGQTGNWATPTARDYKDRGSTQEGRADAGPALGRQSLIVSEKLATEQKTQFWPTQSARDAYAPSDADAVRHQVPLRMVVANWPTPVVSRGAWTYPDGTDHRRKALKLEGAARNFPTPVGTEAKDTRANGKRANGSKSLPLGEVARHFPTPAHRDYKGWDGPKKKSPSKNYGAYSHLELTTSKPGHRCSPKCLRLNPLFAEWLMGWPITWTLLPTDLIDSDSSATAWSHWWRHMRSAFLLTAPESLMPLRGLVSAS